MNNKRLHILGDGIIFVHSAGMRRLLSYQKALSRYNIDFHVYSVIFSDSHKVLSSFKCSYFIKSDWRLLKAVYIKYFHFLKYLMVFKAFLNSRKGDSWLLYTRDFKFIKFAQNIASFREIKVVLECNEYPYLKEVKGSEGSERLLEHDKAILEKLDGLVLISEHLISLLKPINPRIVKVPILASGSRELLCSGGASVSGERDKVIRLFNIGSLSEVKDGLSDFLGLVKSTAIELEKLGLKLELRLVITLISPQDKRRIVEELKNKVRLVLMKDLSREQVDIEKRNSDLHFMIKPVNVQNKYNFPTKLLDYLNTNGLLVIVSDPDIELRSYVKDKVHALCFNFPSPSPLVHGINLNYYQIAKTCVEYLIDDNKKEALIRRKNQLLVEDFNPRKHEIVLKQIFFGL